MSGTLTMPSPSRPQSQAPRALPIKTTAWSANFFRVRGWKSNAVKNKALKDSLDTAAQKLLRPGGPDSAAALAAEKLSPGTEFKIYLRCLDAFERSPNPVDAASLRAASENYIKHYGKHSDRQKKEPETLRKFQVCRKTAAEIDLWIGVQELGDVPWDSKTAMKAAAIRAEFDFASLPVGAQTAENLDGKGVNAAYWVNRAGKDPAKPDRSYLFKPAMDKSDRVGVPKGGEPAREALTGRAADILNGMTGIDFKVPETHIVKVGRERLGRVLPDYVADMNGTGPLVGSLQQFAPSKGELRDNSPTLARAVPPKRCQELAILDIVTMHMDRHAGNLMIDGTEAGADLVPIDNGLSFPDQPDGLSYMATAHNALLRLPGSHKPFTPEMLAKIVRIDPDAIKAALKSEIGDIDAVHPKAAGKVADAALEQSRRAAMFLKLAAPTLTPAMVQVALGQNATRLFDTEITTDADFETLARQIIAGIVPQQAVLAEYFQMSLMEQAVVGDECSRLGWKPAELSVVQLMKVFKSKARKPETMEPGKDEPPATEDEKRDMLLVFPQNRPTESWFQDNIGAWRILAKRGAVPAVKAAVQSAGAKMSSPLHRYGSTCDAESALKLMVAQWAANSVRPVPDAVGNAVVLDGKHDLIKTLAEMLPEPGRSHALQRASDLRAAGNAAELDVVRDKVSGAVRTLLLEKHRSLKEKVDTLPEGPAKRSAIDSLKDGKKFIDVDLNLIEAKVALDEVTLP